MLRVSVLLLCRKLVVCEGPPDVSTLSNLLLQSQSRLLFWKPVKSANDQQLSMPPSSCECMRSRADEERIE